MMTFAQLLDQFPAKASPPILCNPLHHKPGLERGASPEEIEELLAAYFKNTRLGAVFSSLLEDHLQDLILENANQSCSSIHDPNNRPILENFKNQLEKCFMEGLDSRKHAGWTELIMIILDRQAQTSSNLLAKVHCACALSQPDAMRHVRELAFTISFNKSNLINAALGANKRFATELSRIFDSRGWGATVKDKLLLDIAEIIAPILERVFNHHELGRIFTFMDRAIGATYQYLLGTSFTDLFITTLPVRVAGVIVDSPFIFASLKTYIDLSLALDYCPPIQDGIESIKKTGDDDARTGDYRPAIASYTTINLFRLVTTPSLKQITIDSLANTAALRLRLSATDKNHLPFAILECTLALDIDPNHGKALFRRGLALALMKKWNEAIVDFQRAVELDPRSLAAKELAVALRQVGRRIGA